MIKTYAERQKNLGIIKNVKPRTYNSQGNIDQPITQKNCPTCYGYGLWTTGLLVPIGRAQSLINHTVACPSCGANANPAKPRKDYCQCQSQKGDTRVVTLNNTCPYCKKEVQ